jgi:hypothetical protein
VAFVLLDCIQYVGPATVELAVCHNSGTPLIARWLHTTRTSDREACGEALLCTAAETSATLKPVVKAAVTVAAACLTFECQRERAGAQPGSKMNVREYACSSECGDSDPGSNSRVEHRVGDV